MVCVFPITVYCNLLVSIIRHLVFVTIQASLEEMVVGGGRAAGGGGIAAYDESALCMNAFKYVMVLQSFAVNILCLTLDSISYTAY